MIKVFNNSMVRPSVSDFLKTIIFSEKNEAMSFLASLGI